MTNIDKAYIVKSEVCNYYGMTTHEFDKNIHNRHEEFKIPRFIAMYFVVHKTKLTNTSIGKLYEKDHATVSHIKKTVSNWIFSDKSLNLDISILDKRIDSTIEANALSEKIANQEFKEITICL